MCRHRCAAVKYKLDSHPSINPRDVRTVIINNNHAILEFKHTFAGHAWIEDGTYWIPVDLGGGQTTKKYSNKLIGSIASKLLPSNKDIPQDKGASKASQSDDISSIKRRNELHELVATHVKNITVDTIDTLTYEIMKPEHRHIHIQSENIAEHASVIQRHARNADIACYYIIMPGYIDSAKQRLVAEESPREDNASHHDVHVSTQGQLDEFLSSLRHTVASQKGKEPAAQTAIIMVNLDAFSEHEQVALDRLLDDERSIMNIAIPDHVKIITLSKNLRDKALMSRLDVKINSEIHFTDQLTEDDTVRIPVDVEGSANIFDKLLGPTVIHGDDVIWHRSELSMQLEHELDPTKQYVIELVNLPSGLLYDLQSALDHISARGYINRNGYKIPVPDNVRFVCDPTPLSFTHFEEISVERDMTMSDLPVDTLLINTELFDYLLHDYTTDEGKYFTKAGLLEAHQDSELSLFVTSNLSPNQWYSLLHGAEKYNVTLKLAIAPKVDIPAGIKTCELELTAEEGAGVGLHSTKSVFVTNSPYKTIRSLTEDAGETTFIFAVEDYHYDDLVSAITYDICEESDAIPFYNFDIRQSDIITKLNEGFDVILRGTFSEPLLQMMQPLMLARPYYWHNGEKQFLSEDAGKLFFVIVHPKGASNRDTALTFLDDNLTQYDEFDLSATEATSICEAIDEAIDFTNIDLTDTATQAKAFITHRIEHVTDLLNQHNIIQLTGPTGVGKSGLLQEIASRDDGTVVYTGLESLEEWATDKSSKRKILFIDEANIENKHLTMFTPLLPDGSKQLLYKGKIYDLNTTDDSECFQVVFAHNPSEYGGGRNKQLLFSHFNIPELTFDHFHPAYVYEKMLKPIFIEQGITDEAIINEFCEILLELYCLNRTEPTFTVRNLQQRALEFAMRTTGEATFETINPDKYIPIPSQIPHLEKIERLIRTKALMRTHPTHHNLVGLSCVLLEGHSGTGKSALTEYMLTLHGYQSAMTECEETSPYQIYLKPELTASERNDLLTSAKHVARGEPRYYLHLDASLPYKAKKDLLTLAFHRGDAVWIDEINTCIDDGLEPVINTLATGVDSAMQPAENQGFMLFMSANDAAQMKGRSRLSPAIQARSLKLTIEPVNKDDLETIIAHKIDDQSIDTKRLASDLSKACERINLRQLNRHMTRMLPMYEISDEVDSVTYQTSDESPMISSQEKAKAIVEAAHSAANAYLNEHKTARSASRLFTKVANVLPGKHISRWLSYLTTHVFKINIFRGTKRGVQFEFILNNDCSSESINVYQKKAHRWLTKLFTKSKDKTESITSLETKALIMQLLAIEAVLTTMGQGRFNPKRLHQTVQQHLNTLEFLEGSDILIEIQTLVASLSNSVRDSDMFSIPKPGEDSCSFTKQYEETFGNTIKMMQSELHNPYASDNATQTFAAGVCEMDNTLQCR